MKQPTLNLQFKPETLVLRPGMRIEVDTGLRNVWQEYEVADWEEPTVREDGRWVFSARLVLDVDVPTSPHPMIVETIRIRRAGA